MATRTIIPSATQTDVALPSSEFLAGLVQRLSRPSNANRVFTHDTLRVLLLMSARLTHDCDGLNAQASRIWSDNWRGSYHTRDARDRAIRDAHDLADYAWDEATRDAERAHRLLAGSAASVMTTADLLDRLLAVTASRALEAVA
jgi:hypothetical protein